MDYETPDQNLFAVHGDDDTRAIVVDEPVLDGQGRPVLDANNEETYQPVNIAGWKFFLTVKRHKTDPDSAAVLGPLKFETHDDAAQGKTHIGWTAAQATKPVGTYYYDLQRVDADGKVKTFMQGRFVITYDITEGTT